MKKYAILWSCLLILISCKEKENENKQTILTGTTSLLVDENIFPLVEDQVVVFESQYNSRINLIKLSETEAVNALLRDSIKMAVLTRKLTKEEEQIFIDNKITPRITRFAIEGIALIVNRSETDTIVDLDAMLDALKGNSTLGKKIILDSPNSGIMQTFSDISGIERENIKNISSMGSSEEVIKFVANNPGYIGAVGLNWITQAPLALESSVEKIRILKVKNVKIEGSENNYYEPNQSNLAKQLYPLSRHVYLLNYEGSAGLGMGFASFVAGDIGQRIVLKSGLAPIQVTPMKVNVKNEIKNSN